MSRASLFAAYAAGEATPFFPEHYATRAARIRATQRAVRPLAPEVWSALRAQNDRLAPSHTREVHLSALHGGAAAVVTGQQVGLFLGPLYTLYKAASAIAISKALAQEAARPVVPVFWLQTEDHDLPEIATCNVPRDGQPALALSLPASDDARISIAHCELPQEVEACTAALRRELERLPHAAAHLERIERAYRPGVGWSDAFASVLGELFAPEGLVILDPRDPLLARHAAPVHERAVRQAGVLASLLQERCAALQGAGFEPQVHVRPGAPLCFFHPSGPREERSRLTPCDRGFRSAVGEHTEDELVQALAHEPLRFSTSALLRPIVQDTLLPTAAYVGGPGEIAYFAQLGPLYAAFEMPMPLIVPRARFQVIEDKTKRVLDRLDLSARDLQRDARTLAAEHASRSAAFTPEQLEASLHRRFDQALEAVRAEAGALAEPLKHAYDKTRAAVHMAASKLADKHRGALAHKDEATLRDIERVQRALLPGGEPQERVHGFSYYAARYGERAFIERVLHALETSDPFDPTLRDMHP